MAPRASETGVRPRRPLTAPSAVRWRQLPPSPPSDSTTTSPSTRYLRQSDRGGYRRHPYRHRHPRAPESPRPTSPWAPDSDLFLTCCEPSYPMHTLAGSASGTCGGLRPLAGFAPGPAVPQWPINARPHFPVRTPDPSRTPGIARAGKRSARRYRARRSSDAMSIDRAVSGHGVQVTWSGGEPLRTTAGRSLCGAGKS